MKYSAKFRSEAVRKLAMPGGPSATTLSEEVGVAQSTLSRWLRRAGSLGVEAASPPNLVGKVMAARRPQDWSAEEKLAVVTRRRRCRRKPWVPSYATAGCTRCICRSGGNGCWPAW